MLRFRTFLNELVHIRFSLVLSSVLFIIGIGAGWVSTDRLEQFLLSQLGGLSEIGQALSQSENPQWSFFLFIFLNNSIKGVMIIFLGAIFGILPVFFLLVNGMVIGYLLHISMLQGENLTELIFKGLLPHGIIEIPVILIACGFGLRFGGLVLKSMTAMGSSRTKSLGAEWERFMRSTATASFWIVVLLLVAAVIESTINFALMRA